MYTRQGYACLQAHTARAGWEPPNAPALWRAE
ncbi:carbohydrate-binding protein [Streptomyces sp. Act-28]